MGGYFKFIFLNFSWKWFSPADYDIKFIIWIIENFINYELYRIFCVKKIILDADGSQH